MKEDYECIGQTNITDFIPEPNKGKYRDRCLHEDAPCNIYYAHDVANTLDGIDCQYGCCRGCQYNKECGAACNQMKGSE